MNTRRNIRIIPKLDIKGPNLVKGVQLEGLRVLGKPEDFARYYYHQGADELLYIDVVASLYNRNSLHDIISRTAKEIFIPMTVGGGLRTIDDITSVLRAGADKVSLNTAAIKNPEIISRAANIFGSSTITVTIEALKQSNGQYLAYTDNGREFTGVEVISWAKKVESLGAGEILLTSIDREGTGKGYDLDLIASIGASVSIPVVVCGGAGKIEHIVEAVKAGADAVSLSSMLHYDFASQKKDEVEYKDEGNIEFLKKGISSFGAITNANLHSIKKYLTDQKIACRYLENI